MLVIKKSRFELNYARIWELVHSWGVPGPVPKKSFVHIQYYVP